MGFYSKFSEQDLIESYKNQIDYQGKVSKELLEEISMRGSLGDFVDKIEYQKSILEERNRIIREIHKHYMNKSSKEECYSSIKSDLVPQGDILLLVETKYEHIHQNVENLKVDSKTLKNSFLGTIVSFIISSFILFFFFINFNFLILFHFYLLIPAYIINYFIIRSITKKSRENPAVFLATFIATVLNGVFFFLLIYFSE